jgi:hypothetical protein
MPVGTPQNFIGDRNNLGVDSAGNLLFRSALNGVWRFLNTTGKASAASGLVTANQSLLTAKNVDGSTIVANGTQAVGNFGVVSTPGTGLRQMGETANANTKTDSFVIEASVGNGYVSGQPVPVTVNAQISGADGGGAKTVAVAAWTVNNDGTQTAVAVTAPANVALTVNPQDFIFSLAAANIVSGGRLLIRVTTAVTQTAATNTASQVNSVRVG